MNFNRAYDIVSYVEGLPPETRFDYADAEYCLVGHYTRDIGYWDPNMSYLTREVGMTQSQAEMFYAGLVLMQRGGNQGHNYLAECRDRALVCRLARDLLAKWESEVVLAAVKRVHHTTTHYLETV